MPHYHIEYTLIDNGSQLVVLRDLLDIWIFYINDNDGNKLNYKYGYVIIKLEFRLIIKYGQLVILVIIINESKIICNTLNEMKYYDIKGM